MRAAARVLFGTEGGRGAGLGGPARREQRGHHRDHQPASASAIISPALTLSEATVKTHVARILAKLGLRDRVQAVVLAYETGLAAPGQD